MHRFLLLNLLVALATVVAAATASAQPTPTAPGFAAVAKQWETSFAQVEAYLGGTNQDERLDRQFAETLRTIRSVAAAYKQEAEAEIAETQRLLDSLGAPPGEGEPPEDRRIAEQRQRFSQRLAPLKARVGQAELAMTRADDLLAKLLAASRQRFLQRLLTTSPSPLHPSVLGQAPGDLARLLSRILTAKLDWYAGLSAEDRAAFWGNWFWLLLPAAAAVAWVIRRWLVRRFDADPSVTAPSYARRVLAALASAVGNGIIPSAILAMVLVRVGRDPTLQSHLAGTVMYHLAVGMIFLIMTFALTNAILRPSLPHWSCTTIPPRGARRLARRILFVALIFTVDRVVVGSALPLDPSEEARALWGLLIGAASATGLIVLLRGSVWKYVLVPSPGSGEAEAAAGEPQRTARPPFLSSAARLVAMAASVGGVIAIGAGYGNLGQYIINNVLDSVILVGGVYVLLQLCDEAAILLSRLTMDGRRPRLRKDARENLAFWVRLALRTAVIIVAIGLLLTIWGVPAVTLRAWADRLLQGVAIGGVTISLIDIGVAILVLIGGLWLTRLVRGTLEHSVLPRTRLDVGAQNSLATGVGYAGAVIAALAAIAAVGIDLSNVAIVAGALSVGIGFGLQNIVNNFVSGLILLAERPIKVGDWVVVGSHQGFVRHISVRATEIQTFDRSSVILPNSDLLSQAVVNLTHTDKTGRVEIRVGVAYGSDPEKVRETLLACATAHPDVLSWPRPMVFFVDFGANSLDFVLYAFIENVERRLTVASELRFAIDKAFAAAGIEIPFAQSDVHIRDLDRLIETLQRAIETWRRPPEPAPQPPAAPPAPPPPAAPPAASTSSASAAAAAAVPDPPPLPRP